jgi:hypothetical protein
MSLNFRHLQVVVRRAYSTDTFLCFSVAQAVFGGVCSRRLVHQLHLVATWRSPNPFHSPTISLLRQQKRARPIWWHRWRSRVNHLTRLIGNVTVVRGVCVCVCVCVCVSVCVCVCLCACVCIYPHYPHVSLSRRFSSDKVYFNFLVCMWVCFVGIASLPNARGLAQCFVCLAPSIWARSSIGIK